MPEVNRIDLLWKVILRYDAYIGTTNAKAAFLIAWNTFLFGTVLVKGFDFVNQFQPLPWAVKLSATLLIILSISALLSLRYTFRVVNPYLKSPQQLMVYHSVVFFGHVAQFEDEKKFHDAILKADEDNIVRDLSYQVHVLAKGLHSKFSDLRVAITVILLLQIPVISLAVLSVVARKFITP